MYEPGNWISRVWPTPLWLVVAREDKITVTDVALAAYERALEPKRLVLIPGGYFPPCLDRFPMAEAAATGWFGDHLTVAEASCINTLSTCRQHAFSHHGDDHDCKHNLQ
jgi:fermentation-respiration switch protein FrsA (DUF1100 family)